MSNSNQRPWYKDPRILFPAIVAIIVALIVGFFALYAALPQTPTTPVFIETIGEIDTDGIYEISWEKSIRAKSYILQEDMDPSFTNPRTIDTNSGTRGQIYGKANGDYYYRVRACNDAGESEWSSSRRVTVEISTTNGSSQTPTPTITPTPTHIIVTPTPTPTPTPAPRPMPSPTPRPTSKPTATPSPTPTPTQIQTLTTTPTLTPTPTMITATATPTPTPTPTPAPTPSPTPTRDNTSGWRTYRDKIGSSIHIESIPGRTDNAIEITYDLEEGGWVAISKRIDPEILSEEEGIKFFYTGSGRPNTIELKLVYEDVGGTTFGALWNRATVTDDWVSFDVPYSRFDCWWPEDNCLRYGNNLNLTKVIKIEFAISNKPKEGDVYGSGIVIIDDVQGITS